MSILVIPADAGELDQAYSHSPFSWFYVMTENGCERIENFGSAWCVANGVDGLGIFTERPPAPEPVPAPAFVDRFMSALDSFEAPDTAVGFVSALREELAPFAALGGVV